MTEEVENLILEQMRAFPNQIEGLRTEMRSEFQDVKLRLNRMESTLIGIRRNEVDSAEDTARQQVNIDRLVERVQRIERRLDRQDET